MSARFFRSRPRRASALLGFATGFLLTVPTAQTADLTQVDAPPLAAPPAPPTLTRPQSDAPAVDFRRLAAATPYSIGEPTDEEQLYVEFINRARANPPAEGIRLSETTDLDVLSQYRAWNVDLARLRSDFAAIAAAPPLSIEGRLTEAARRHSRDMFDNQFQEHTGSDGSSAADRVTAAGYPWNRVGENIFANAASVWHGHAGFNADWGPGPGGVQSPPGHRLTIHSRDFREIGVGVVLGTHGTSGPQVVTQEFGNRTGLSPFVTGVVYYDLNGNGFYDLGEGIGGVTVRASGTAAYAVTARSGGYSVPVAGNGTYTVTFQVPGLADANRSVVVANGENAKADLSPTYSPPVIGGSSVAYVGRDNAYAFSPVGAATEYDWRSLRRLPWTSPEGAEAGLGRFEADVSPDHNPIGTTVVHAGGAAFHLAHPAPVRSQWLTLRRPVRLGAASEWSFWSRLRFATADQVARAQISLDDGRSWQDVWSQAGSDNQGEIEFTRRAALLQPFAGQTVRLRLGYTFTSGTFYAGSGAHLGWHIDDILVTDAEELSDEIVSTAPPGQTFAFRPPTVGAYFLQTRARIADRTLPWGPGLAVTAEEGGPLPAVVRVTSLSAAGGGNWELVYLVESGTLVTPSIQAAAAPSGPWTTQAGVTFVPGDAPGVFRARFPIGSESTRFYRVMGQ